MDRHRPHRRVTLLATFICCYWGHFLVGAENSPKPLPQSCLLLKSGALLTGSITFRGERYCVEDEHGKTWVTLADTAMLCSDKAECFARQQAKLADEDATGHLRLADWCLRNALPGFAKAELEHVRRINPRHPKLKSLSVRIAHYEAPRTQEEQIQLAAAVMEHEDPFLEHRKTLGEAAVNEFIERVQPQMLNHCGTSACHGGRQVHSFKLLGIPRGRRPSQRQSAANLTSALTVISGARPEESRLLTFATKRHGGGLTPPVASEEDESFQTMKAWIESLVPRDAKMTSPASGELDRAKAESAPSVPAPAAPETPSDEKNKPEVQAR